MAVNAVQSRVLRAVSAAEGGPSERERKLERQVKFLADRLALSLMSHGELMQAVVLLEGRSDDRETLKADPGFELCKRMVRRALVVEMQKAEFAEGSK